MSDTNTNAAMTIDAVNGGQSIIQEGANVPPAAPTLTPQQQQQQKTREARAVADRFITDDTDKAVALRKAIAVAAWLSSKGRKGKDRTTAAAVADLRAAAAMLRDMADAAEAVGEAVFVLYTGDQSPLKGKIRPCDLAERAAVAVVGVSKSGAMAEAADAFKATR